MTYAIFYRTINYYRAVVRNRANTPFKQLKDIKVEEKNLSKLVRSKRCIITVYCYAMYCLSSFFLLNNSFYLEISVVGV